MEFEFKAVVEDIEAVPEDFRELYEEARDGNGHVLKTSVLQGHPALTNVKATADKLEREKRDLAKRLADAEEKANALPEDFDPEEWERLKGSDADDDKNKRGDDQERVKRAVEQTREKLERKHAEELSAVQQRNEALEREINRRVVDGGLTETLSKGHVPPEFLPAAKALLREKGMIRLVEDEGRFDAMADTDIGEVPLSKFVTDWLSTDEGKPFVKPPSGGDARGSSNGRGSADPNPWKQDTFNLSEQGRLVKNDPAKAARLMRAAGVSDDRIRRVMPA